MASIFKRSETWWISYYVNGKQVRESLKTSNKRIAEREKQAREAELLKPHRRVAEKKNPPVDIFWERYLEYANAHLRERTIEIQTLFWGQLMEFTKAQRLGDIRQKDIEEFKRWKKEKGAADQSVNNALKDIQAIYNHALKLGLYTGPNPAKGIERFKLQKKMPEFHSEKEAIALLKIARQRGQQVERVILLGVWAGFRKGEIVNARWEWLDFNKTKPLITIKGFPGFDIKDSEDRAIPMSQRIYDALYPHRQNAGFIFESDRPSEGKNRYRFDPRKALISTLKEAGLTTKNPFQRLRHTFGSLHAQKGVSIFKVSKWMGHSSVKVTERHYAGLQAYDSEIDSF